MHSKVKLKKSFRTYVPIFYRFSSTTDRKVILVVKVVIEQYDGSL